MLSPYYYLRGSVGKAHPFRGGKRSQQERKGVNIVSLYWLNGPDVKRDKRILMWIAILFMCSAIIGRTIAQNYYGILDLIVFEEE